MFFDINTCSDTFLHPLPIRWEFPSSGWVKINIDGAASDSPSLVSCVGIFRRSMVEFISGFYAFLDIQTSLVTEFYGVIHVIEEAQKMDLNSLWLECDFASVCVAFTTRTNVPLILRNR